MTYYLFNKVERSDYNGSLGHWSVLSGRKRGQGKKIVEKDRIIIGYSEEDHPDYYEIMRSINPGDIVFIKARFMLNQPMKIKAVGIAVDTDLSNANGMDGQKGIIVKWLKDLTDEPVVLEKTRVNDGSTRTIYQERDLKIIDQIVELLKKS